ncbi:MAG: MerR family transcriptional regulator [Abditibacteriales bacterium]|nr:MerR family transcriptional regulator [Abditibacteriales bacterium]MDW8367537.1 MerR family transcriptional regulator [Abditibacteriales bacterium]
MRYEEEVRFHQHEDGVYYISVAARMLNTHPQTLRMYERLGLIHPKRTGDSEHSPRLYSQKDIERIRRIQHLTQDLGVNLAGVEVIFKLLNEMEQMRREMEEEIQRIKQLYLEAQRQWQQQGSGKGNSTGVPPTHEVVRRVPIVESNDEKTI